MSKFNKWLKNETNAQHMHNKIPKMILNKSIEI